MSDTVIKVENLSKSYLIRHQGQERYTTLRDVIARDAKTFIKKLASPFGSNYTNSKDSQEEFYALENLSFEIKKGARVGIIGRNGAGKSTLLKVLSRITEPTTGRVTIDGRVASLLEVGTGFHPELTGRENIFLNGAILGMPRADIKRKFDEIVDFAEVEKFLDTPVKRYSSGMYVRLAFAVAAHLEPEILVIDEVLAVGDAEFQNKCLGRMESHGNDGRTVLFVSHNMSAISSLCSEVILLKKGRVDFIGKTNVGIEKYLSHVNSPDHFDFDDLSNHVGSLGFSKFTDIKLFNAKFEHVRELMVGDELNVKLEFELYEDVPNLELGFGIQDLLGTVYSRFFAEWEGLTTKFKKGRHVVSCRIPFLPYLPGTYGITPWLKRRGGALDDQVGFAAQITLIGRDINGFSPDLDRYPNTGVYVKSHWQLDG